MTRGRPPGAKKKSTPKVIEEAKRMFITGSSITEIKEKFGMASMNAFYKWAEEGNWNQQRDEFFKKLSSQQIDTIFRESVENTENALNDLKTIRDKAISSINDGFVNPRKFSEASKAYTDSVELERKIRIEGLQLQFIQEVAKVLRQEITDPLLLTRIGNRLKDLFASSQRSSLLTTGKKDNDE